jgi:F0F1-type ATP synthase delta subunit
MLTTLNRSANALERIADTFESLVKEWSTSIRILPAAMTLNEEIQDLVKSPEIVKES